ncbi:hypothetical protein BK654_08030 [Pseudomonas brassicacearum]|uniref:cell wall hydrolase n=1 Tax=Pseudomonas brassicacearum TaxID=930166 RepID=UPI000F49786B|nr:cell wall hydrolase [Pseudomonas brassicacearum]ROM79306.1 hypothetical protein BK654_08030 [Pseudomonas brassicacearum]
MTVSEKDRDILARTLWGEAPGESLAGQIAVAWTIRNRVEDDKAKLWWGEGYAGVCLKPYQFICWNQNDPTGFGAWLAAGHYRPLLASQMRSMVVSGCIFETSQWVHLYSSTLIPPANCRWAGGVPTDSGGKES